MKPANRFRGFFHGIKASMKEVPGFTEKKPIAHGILTSKRFFVFSEAAQL
jgi:hypothetical protein